MREAGEDLVELLPLVHRSEIPFWASIIGTLVFLAASAILWWPARAHAQAPQASEREVARDNFLRFGCPVMAVLCLSFVFTTWRQFRVERDGIVLRYFLHEKRLPWSDLRKVSVNVQRVGTDSHTRYVHQLEVAKASGGALRLPFGNASFNFRDVIAAAAKAAGVDLETE